MKKYILHIAISILLGAAAGAGAVAFHFLLSRGKDFSIQAQHSFSQYIIVIFPIIGAILILLMVKLFPKQAEEKGVVNVIKSLIKNAGNIPLSTTVFNFFASLFSIGTGTPLGPEAPAAQIGCGIGSFLARRLNFSQNDIVMYTAAAGSAAISAIFNAPIAGVFFGIEVLLLNDMKNNALSALIIASVTSDLLSRGIMGDVRVFSFPAVTPARYQDYPLLLGLGILCGFFSLLYSMLAVKTRSFLAKYKHCSFFALPVVSLIFGTVLLAMPHLYGIGYDSIILTAQGAFPIHILGLLFVLKFIFVLTFLAAGGYGGIFAPSLILGAAGGYLFALVMNSCLGMTGNPVLYCIAGMAGMLAGMNSVPLTAIMLVFEMTNDYHLVLPLMITSVIAYVFTLNYNNHTIYSKALLRTGIDVTRRGNADILGSVRIKDLALKPFTVVGKKMRFHDLIGYVLSAEEGTVFVTDDKEKLCGIISLNNIRQTIATTEMGKLFIASDLMVPFSAITMDSSISEAAEAAEKCGTPLIPVIKTKESGKVVGAISQNDIITAYNDQLERTASDEFFIKYSYRY